jgi:lipopolysaccharide biosynthesis glycosyltransferase
MKGEIFFVVDAKFFPLAAVQAVRALEASETDIGVHVFVDGPGAEGVAFDPGVSARAGDRLRLHRGELAPLTPAALPDPKPWPRQVFGRLFAPCALSAGRLLYLDVDVVIDGSLDELFALDMCGAPVAAVGDHMIEAALEEAGDVSFGAGRPHGARYFNSGMLLIDRQRWLARDITREMVAYLNAHGAIYADQHCVNHLFPDWLPLSPRWNCLITYLELGLAEAVAPRVIHVVGFVKPWHREFAEQYPGYARKYRAMARAAAVDLEALPASERKPRYRGFKGARIKLHRLVYRLGFAGRRVRAKLAGWRRARAEFVVFLSQASASGLFADAFVFAAPPDAEPNQYDGRIFRVSR